MRSSHSILKKLIIVFLFLSFSSLTYAEYYFECNEPEIVLINTHPHPCHHHRAHHHRYRHKPGRYVGGFVYRTHECDLDLATGDDNPCVHPEMQIN